MEDDINFLGKRKKNLNYLGKWKTTSFFEEMEDNLYYLGKGKMTYIFEANGRRPQLFSQIEDKFYLELN